MWTGRSVAPRAAPLALERRRSRPALFRVVRGEPTIRLPVGEPASAQNPTHFHTTRSFAAIVPVNVTDVVEVAVWLIRSVGVVMSCASQT